MRVTTVCGNPFKALYPDALALEFADAADTLMRKQLEAADHNTRQKCQRRPVMEPGRNKDA